MEFPKGKILGHVLHVNDEGQYANKFINRGKMNKWNTQHEQCE